MKQIFILIFSLTVIVNTLPAALPERIVLTPAATLPHDSQAYTQGLLFDSGFLYESTGQYGQSTLRKVEPKTGEVLMHVQIPQRFFAEGLALHSEQFYQLTWQEKTAFVFDKQTLKKTGDFRYAGEGWGLTSDGEHLIMSNGSATIQFIEPKKFKMKRKIEVTDKNSKTKKTIPIEKLNELEWIHGEIWANVWQTTKIVRINPKNGHVLGWIEMAAFVPEKHKNDTEDCVLNGIAFDPETEQVYVTGKNWDVIYVFRLETPK